MFVIIHVYNCLFIAGIDTLVEVAGLDVDHIPAFATLSQHERVTLQTAVNQYHDQGILEQWLTDCKLQALFKKYVLLLAATIALFIFQCLAYI